MDTRLPRPRRSGDPRFAVEGALHRLRELSRAGLRPRVANQVLVCDLVLTTVRLSPGSAPEVSGHIAAALSDPDVFEAAKRLCTPAFQAPAWEALAHATEQPIRARCLHLAQLSRRRRLRVVS